MKTIKLFSIFLLGVFGLFVIYWNLIEVRYLKIYSGVVSGFILIVWSMLLGLSEKKSYKGGAATIVGVILLTISISLVFDLFLSETADKNKRLKELIAITFLSFSGAALLKQGHKYHCLLKKTSIS